MQSKTYEIIMKNKFESWERQILSTLYLPIMGYKAFTLYQTLLNDAEFGRSERSITFDVNHIEIMTSMSESTIKKARKILEGLKLLQTFENKIDNTILFYLYSPLEPDDFFNAPLLNNMLIARIGSEEYEKIRFLLRDSTKNLAKFQETSASFSEVFKDEINLPDLSNQISFNSKSSHRKLGIPQSEINTIKTKLAKEDIVIEFTDQNVVLLSEIKDAYRVNIDNLVEAIKFAYDFKNAKISRRKLCEKAAQLTNRINEPTSDFVPEIRSQREFAKVTEFETHNSESYFKAIMKSKTLSPSELGLLKDLRNSYKLHDSVINALIDFSYLKNDKKVVANYILKIASSLAEKGINKPLDAMDYLKTAFKESRTKNNFKNKTTSTLKTNYVSKVEWTNEYFKEDLKALEMNEENIEEILGKIG